MSLNSFIGPKPNLLDINQVNPPMRLEVSQPVLNFADMAKLRDIEQHTQGKFRSAAIDITYPLAWGREGRGQTCLAVRQAVDEIRGAPTSSSSATAVWAPRRWPFPRCWRCRRSTSIWCARAAHHDRPGGRNRHCARSAPLRRAGRLRRRGRVHPTWPWKPWPTCTRSWAATCRPTRRSTTTSRPSARPVQDHVQDGREHLHELIAVPSCSKPLA